MSRNHRLSCVVATLCLGLSFVSSTRIEAVDDALRRSIEEEVGATDLRFIDIDLPTRHLPQRVILTITTVRGEEVLSLSRVDDRGPEYRLFEVGTDGERVEIAPPEPRTYRGRIVGDARSVAAVSLVDAGLLATVYRSDGSGFTIRPLQHLDGTAARTAHVLFPPQRSPHGHDAECGTDGDPEHDSHDNPDLSSDSILDSRETAGGGAGVPCELHVADLAYDSDYEFFEDDCDGNTDTCVEIIEQGLNVTNAIYIRDLKTVHRTSAMILRTDPETDFYAQWPDASDFGDMLSSFRSEWNANMGDIEYDMAYFMTGKSRPEYGGLAYVGVVCSGSRYGMGIGGRGYAGIFRHELGHNWAATHSCGTERRFIMCGNSISAISGYNVGVMGRHRDSRNCLVTEPYDPDDDTPPLARLDRAIVALGEGPVSIDVIPGDSDLGCSPLRLADFDKISGFGASILTIDSDDPDDPIQLLYIPRSDFLGTDYFTYTVVDEDGQETQGAVIVEVAPRAMLVHLEFEEIDGDEFDDSSGFDHEGELRGDVEIDAVTTEGRYGNACDFQGVDGQYISLGDPSLLSLRREVTLAAWFRFDALNASGGERIISKGSDSYRIERDGTTARLRFTCTGVSVAGNGSGSVVGTTDVTDGEWHHVVGIFDGTRMALFVDGELETTRTASGLINTNSSSFRVGDDEFAGPIDEVRAYNWGLSDDEARALFTGARIENTDPPHRAAGVVPGSPLAWLPVPGATTYHVYVGTDRDAVTNATSGDPERRSIVRDPVYVPDLDLGETYFWRIDPLQDGEPQKGNVRSFTTSFAFTNFDEPARGSSSYTPGAGARELGFRTTSTPTGGEDPLAEVVSTSSTPSSPVFGHRSVRATTRFGEVDLSERGTTIASLILQSRSTGYEEEDFVTVTVSNGEETRNLVRYEDPISLSQRAGTGYANYAAIIPADWDTASLEVSSSSNSGSGSERYDFDRIGFSCFEPFRVIAHTYFAEANVNATSFTPGANDSELGFTTERANTSGTNRFLGVVETSQLLSTRSLVQRSLQTTTSFDSVDLSRETGVWATVVFRVRDTGYESSDYLRIYATNGEDRVDLINVNGDTGLDSFADDDYASVRTRLPDEWEEAQLVIEGSTNSSAGSEGYDIRLVELTSEDIGDPCVVEDPEPEPTEPEFRRGDTNGDGNFDLSDGIGVLNFLFVGGPAPACEDAADTDNTGLLDLSDGVNVFNYLFLGGIAPPDPGIDECGPDPDEDALGCESYPLCEEG